MLTCTKRSIKKKIDKKVCSNSMAWFYCSSVEPEYIGLIPGRHFSFYLNGYNNKNSICNLNDF